LPCHQSGDERAVRWSPVGQGTIISIDLPLASQPTDEQSTL
jgi:hypothetical protein